MKKRIKITGLTKPALFAARHGLPFIVFTFAYILAKLLIVPQNERAWTAFTACSMLESAMMCLTMLFCGVIFIDILAKHNTK